MADDFKVRPAPMPMIGPSPSFRSNMPIVGPSPSFHSNMPVIGGVLDGQGYITDPAMLDTLKKLLSDKGITARPENKPLPSAEQLAKIGELLREISLGTLNETPQQRADRTGEFQRDGIYAYAPRTPQQAAADDQLQRDLDAAQVEADKTGKPVLVDGFYVVGPQANDRGFYLPEGKDKPFARLLSEL